MQVYDLSHPIHMGMPIYPGEPPTEVREMANGPYVTFYVQFSSHAGTSIDVPKHIYRNGRSLEQYSVDRFVVPAAVWHTPRREDGPIDEDEVASFFSVVRLAPGWALLIDTDWARLWGTERYDRHPYLTLSAAKLLVERGVSIVGIDTPNIDSSVSNTVKVHEYLLTHDVLIVENLNGLSQLPEGQFLFSCLPLPLSGADGSPVRAVAWPLAEETS